MADLHLSRRHVAGAESARGVLFTVLGEFVRPGNCAAWTSAIIDVLGRLGVEEKATRQALMRTAADGWLRTEKVGRRTRWLLTEQAEQLLTTGAARIFSFRGAAEKWDGQCVLVLVRAPETERPARHLVRTRLSWAGFGSPAPGVWLSTHADRVAEIEKVLADAGLSEDAQIFQSRHAGGGSLQSLVRQAWAVDEIDRNYRDFIAEFGSGSTRDPLARTVELVHAWRRFPWTDPELPLELLPARWSGTQAARLFARQHARWAPDARAEWQRLNAE